MQMEKLAFDVQSPPKRIDCKYVIEYLEPVWKKAPHSKCAGQPYHFAMCLRCKVGSQQEQIDQLMERMRDLKSESPRALNRFEQIEVKQINILHKPAPAVQQLLPSIPCFAPVSSNSIEHINALVSSLSKTALASISSRSQLEIQQKLEIQQSSEIQ